MRAVAVALSLLVLVACGGGSEGPAAAQFRTECADAAEAGKLALAVDTPTPPRMGAQVTWQLIVTNADDKDVTVVFPSAQPGDVALEQSGEEIYRWSRERTFAQSIRCFTLHPGERARLDLTNDQLEINAGEYELTASLSARPSPPDVRRTVTVRQP